MEYLTTASPKRSAIARIFYGAIFVVIVPAALGLWAHESAGVIHAPAFHYPLYGAVIAFVGVEVVITGMVALWRRGGGLPMNAFPPPKYVASNIYALVPHPIYGGFVLTCAGAALFTGSATGLWIVSPCAALACVALVLGYELPDLRRRFGKPPSSVWLARDREHAPSIMERLRIYFVVLLPWFVGFELISYLGAPPEAIATYFNFERKWPVLQWMELFYFSTYVAVLLFPLFVPSGSSPRRFTVLGYTSMATIFPLYLLLPFYVPPRPFVSSTWAGILLEWERSSNSGVAAFPSFHVVWACIVASAFGLSAGRLRKVAIWTWVLLVAASCIATGMHSIADVLAGFAVFFAVAKMPDIWQTILRLSERVANSWREYRFGPVRVINHGVYAGAAAAVGIVVINSILGPGKAIISASICVGALAGAALWAQWVEGSPTLLRPLGFYGGMLGSILGAMMAVPLRVPLWTALAAVCVAAPWIQAIGRLRCLVQGCCHGRPAKTVLGIRYNHPRSRVCRIAQLDSVPVHATPVYSILWNVVVAAALIRLVTLHMPSAFLCGVYLLLSGCGRFVEEAYRGEPQTRIFAGLRFYQWIAVVCVIAGAVLMCVRTSSTPSFDSLRSGPIILAVWCGLLTWFVSGVDFPESSHRFARLT